MDLSKFKTSDWILVGGGAAVFIGGFLKWLTVDTGIGSFSDGSAFDFFFTGTIPWLLVVAAAVVTVLLLLEVIDNKLLPWTLLILGATGLSALLLLIRLLFNPGVNDRVGRGFGMILTVLGGIVAAVGAFMNFQAEGGKLSDLTDIDKLKASFSDKGDAMPPPPRAPQPPPPPASGDNMPPPPAPPSS